jgi:hypothetical protein
MHSAAVFVNLVLSGLNSCQFVAQIANVYSIDNTTNFLNNRLTMFNRRDSDPPDLMGSKTRPTGNWLVRLNLLDVIHRRHSQSSLQAAAPRRDRK